MKCKFISGVVVLCSALTVQLSADNTENEYSPNWKATCSMDATSFDFAFQSKSGDWDNDDMSVSVQFKDGRKMSLPFANALYVKRNVVSDVKSVCDNIGGFSLPNSKGLFWISANNRPGWDLLTLALIDIKHGKVLDVKEKVGPIKDINGRQRLAIRSASGGYEIRLEREWMKNTGTDSAENSIEDWLVVRVKDNRIETKWAK